MPFGINKKDKAQEEDSNRRALFGSRSKSSKSTTPQTNPYAVQATSSDPYAAKPSSTSLSQPPAYNGRSPSPLRNEKSPVPQGGYGNPERFVPSGSNYAQQGGYGGDAYGRVPVEAQSSQPSRYGPSGYGGLGRSNSQDTMSTDAGRAALFGDAPQRQQQMQATMPMPQSADNSYTAGAGTSGTTFGAASEADAYTQGYGASTDRQLTAEEQEEEDVTAAKTEIKYIKQQDVASTRNARRIAEQAEATGRETLARLGQQGERIHNTERNLDMASNQNRLAEEKARELKTLNRSMFAMHVANPFTAKKREEAANAIALDKHQRERAQMDATRANAYSSKARQNEQAREFGGVARPPTDKASLAQRAKYQFEAESEDDEMENEIDANLVRLPTVMVLTPLRRALC